MFPSSPFFSLRHTPLHRGEKMSPYFFQLTTTHHTDTDTLGDCALHLQMNMDNMIASTNSTKCMWESSSSATNCSRSRTLSIPIYSPGVRTTNGSIFRIYYGEKVYEYLLIGYLYPYIPHDFYSITTSSFSSNHCSNHNTTNGQVYNYGYCV